MLTELQEKKRREEGVEIALRLMPTDIKSQEMQLAPEVSSLSTGASTWTTHFQSTCVLT